MSGAHDHCADELTFPVHDLSFLLPFWLHCHCGVFGHQSSLSFGFHCGRGVSTAGVHQIVLCVHCCVLMLGHLDLSAVIHLDVHDRYGGLVVDVHVQQVYVGVDDLD